MNPATPITGYALVHIPNAIRIKNSPDMLRESLAGLDRGIHLGFQPLDLAKAVEHRGQLLTRHHHDAVAVGDDDIAGGDRHAS